MTDLTLGQRIAECRKKRNISQEALGEKMGVSRQAISKWEADGAVPEIDKLIALSKLFGVSIGWLLGIEEPSAPEKEEISEELLRKIEEIVLRYRPRKQPMSTKKKLLIGIAGALALWVAVILYNKWSVESSMLAFTYANVDAINSQNASIQAQLNSLTNRLDAMAAAEEEQSKLLSDYSFDLEVWTDVPGADVIFSAVPKSWTEGDSAYLTFQIPGENAIQADCKWDGAFLTATVPLEAKDGYQICLTIVHTDGSLEQQVLYKYDIENLANELTVGCEVTWGTAKFRFKEALLEMEVVDGEVHVTRPGIAGSDIYFTAIDYILYQSSADGYREVARYNLYEHIPITEEGVAYGPEIWCYGKPIFTVPDIQDGDGLELWVKAEMSNGMSAMEMAGSWAYNNGEFIAAVPAE